MRVGWQTLTLVAAAVLTAAAQSAQGQYRPEVPVLKCAHEGEPVPGISGAVFQYFYPPGIDAAGNVLISASMTGPGITAANNEGIWFGQPGAMSLVARDGWPAPDLPGVVFSSVASEIAAVSENGWIVFTAYMTGAGVTAGVNDRAVFCGPPGDFHLVMRTGDPVPELGANIVISGTEYMGAGISDNGTLFVGAGLGGSGLPATYDRAYWIGPRGGLQLAVWEGMPVQGCSDCAPGVYFRGVGEVSFNDAGQVAFHGALQGAGVGWYNNTGRWIGAPSALQLQYREWQLMPLFGTDVVVFDPQGGLYALNGYGDEVDRIRLYGAGITMDTDWLLVAGGSDSTVVIVREGDLTPEAGEGTAIGSLSSPFINDLRQVLYRVKFTGPGINESNEYGAYLGTYDSPRLILRDGASASYFASGTSLFDVGLVSGMVAMNDAGDFVAVIGVQNATGGRAEMLGLWRGLTWQYIPLLEAGAELFGRTLTLTDASGDYGTLTGGADGLPQSFNDRRQLTTLLDFTDGTSGVYRVGPPLLGDTDGDGQVGVPELVDYAGCANGAGAGLRSGCEALDLNLDGIVDMRDVALLQAMLGEAR